MGEAVEAVGRFVSAMIDSPEPVSVRFTPSTLYGRYMTFHMMSTFGETPPLTFDAFERALTEILEPARRIQSTPPVLIPPTGASPWNG